MAHIKLKLVSFNLIVYYEESVKTLARTESCRTRSSKLRPAGHIRPVTRFYPAVSNLNLFINIFLYAVK